MVSSKGLNEGPRQREDRDSPTLQVFLGSCVALKGLAWSCVLLVENAKGSWFERQETCSEATQRRGDPIEEAVDGKPGQGTKEDTVRIESFCNTSESQIEARWQSWEERCKRTPMTRWVRIFDSCIRTQTLIWDSLPVAKLIWAFSYNDWRPGGGGRGPAILKMILPGRDQKKPK